MIQSPATAPLLIRDCISAGVLANLICLLSSAQIGTIGVQHFNHQPGVQPKCPSAVKAGTTRRCVLAADGNNWGIPEAAISDASDPSFQPAAAADIQRDNKLFL